MTTWAHKPPFRHFLLPDFGKRRKAVTDFARRTNTVRECRNVPELVAGFIAAKEKAGRSEAYLRDMRLRVTRFGGVFQLPVAHVTGKMLQTWLDGMNLSNRTKLNELRLAAGLLNFAVRRKYAPGPARRTRSRRTTRSHAQPDAGDYFNSGDLAYQLQEIIRATAALLKKIQRNKAWPTPGHP